MTSNIDIYNFDASKTCEEIISHMKDFLCSIHCTNVVLGISGGKDSTVCAAIAKKCVGQEHVYGVMMPNGIQKDIEDSKKVIQILGIKSIEINIEDAFCSIRDSIENNGLEVSEDTKINLPPRLRMSTLYAVAQSVNGCVLCTDNKDERILGYFTVFGDGAGSYDPIRELTVSEVIKIGKYLGLPDYLVEKKPGDGLQNLGDEDRLGLKYSDLDSFIRCNRYTDELYDNVMSRFKKNKFKTDMVNIPGPLSGKFNDFVTTSYYMEHGIVK